MRPVLAYLRAWVLGASPGRQAAPARQMPALAIYDRYCAVQALMRPVLAYLHTWVPGCPLGGKLHECSSMCAAQ